MQYKINEIFVSVQGEGHHQGVRAAFIRLQGCSVGCPWCDTKYTWHGGGNFMWVDEILEEVTGIHHVVITGGEPTLWNLDDLLRGLHSQGHFTQLETSGQNDLKGSVRPNFITWSPKANLGYRCPDKLRAQVDEVKFVIDEDIDWITVFATAMSVDIVHHPHIILMPEGCPPTEEAMKRAYDILTRVPYEQQYYWKVCDRLQYRLGVR